MYDGRYSIISHLNNISAGKDVLKSFSEEVIRKFPEVDAVVFAAGVQRATNFKKPECTDLDELFQECNVNYLAILALIHFFLPHFLKLSAGGHPTFLIPITSGLAMVPKAEVSNYCATKAALHSLSISLSNSLTGTNVHVMEILPPLVESELHDQQGTTEALSKHWMPLDEFTKYAMEGMQRGDFNIVVPSMKGIWEKLEAERIAMTGKVGFTKDK
ncbi:NAD-binding protein [Fomitiporia mediterranea MF3/22]|uniref:NAD-binding protein n=1 Tax=Fomitiporia mediterranea (strain MF3/22) TaxID=694068 RepID=UPI0004409327|nr:NAD-binding protein [Fomitiporia mediterranea MF3/22]EJD03582.1 NAD-binding protein [Fomitiporia mediterranea MF3/22]